MSKTERRSLAGLHKTTLLRAFVEFAPEDLHIDKIKWCEFKMGSPSYLNIGIREPHLERELCAQKMEE